MAKKIRRRNKSQSADIEAQPESEGVPYDLSCTLGLPFLYKDDKLRDAYEMASGHNIQASGAAGGSNSPVQEMVCEVLAGSSTLPQAGTQKDSSSGEHSTSF
jgi:hypothetical protein